MNIHQLTNWGYIRFQLNPRNTSRHLIELIFKSVSFHLVEISTRDVNSRYMSYSIHIEVSTPTIETKGLIDCFLFNA
jgi:hypothetical protein